MRKKTLITVLRTKFSCETPRFFLQLLCKRYGPHTLPGMINSSLGMLGLTTQAISYVKISTYLLVRSILINLTGNALIGLSVNHLFKH